MENTLSSVTTHSKNIGEGGGGGASLELALEAGLPGASVPTPVGCAVGARGSHQLQPTLERPALLHLVAQLV